MPLITTPVEYSMHDATFAAYAAPSRGSSQLCAWRVSVSADTAGTAHRVSHEEVLLVLKGRFSADIDGVEHDAVAGDVLLVPVGSWFRLSTHSEGGTAWVTTSVGLTADTVDGMTINPPWAS